MKSKKIEIEIPELYESEILREIAKYLLRFTDEYKNDLIEISELGLNKNRTKDMWERYKFFKKKYSLSFD